MSITLFLYDKYYERVTNKILIETVVWRMCENPGFTATYYTETSTRHKHFLDRKINCIYRQ